MTILLLALTIVALLALADTVRTLLDGGPISPPRSHDRDPRFQPPATLLD